MSVRYFRKLTPNTKVLLPDNSYLKFDTVDGLVGFFATDAENLHKHFEECMKRQQYCISEISQKEFMEEYVAKKKTVPTLKPTWREEVSKGSHSIRGPIADFGVDHVSRVVGLSGASDVKPKAAVALALEDGPQAVAAVTGKTEPPPKPEFTPRTGRRTRKPKVDQ